MPCIAGAVGIGTGAGSAPAALGVGAGAGFDWAGGADGVAGWAACGAVMTGGGNSPGRGALFKSSAEARPAEKARAAAQALKAMVRKIIPLPIRLESGRDHGLETCFRGKRSRLSPLSP